MKNMLKGGGGWGWVELKVDKKNLVVIIGLRKLFN